MSRDFARKLRCEQTDAEQRLWGALRNRQMRQFKFRRQQPIGPYIVDFVCFDAKFVIELDGGQHTRNDIAQYDAARTLYLESEGYRVMRIWNGELFRNFRGVMEGIYFALESRGN
jgi:very-short-patch-repair endonuclease